MIDRAPDLFAPLLGWRAWQVAKTVDGWRLHSVHMGDPWPAREELVATCRRDRFMASGSRTHERHHAPASSCHCGVYGATQPETARQYFVASWAEDETVTPLPLADDYVPRAIGRVRLWGRVLACRQGYRASHAYPERIWLPSRRPDGSAFDYAAAAMGLLDYGVPVEILDVGTRAEIAAVLPRERAA
jgi:hypothetical protein